MPATTSPHTLLGGSRTASARPALNRRLRAAAAVVLCGLIGAGCGFDIQTNRAYTPADGVNADAGGGAVKVRNVLVISPRPGEGVVSATLTAERPDALVGVTGVAIAADGTTTPLQVTRAGPVAVGTVEPVQLLVPAQRANIFRVRAPSLQAGLTATLTLRFRSAGEVTLTALVVDANLPDYRDLPTG